MHARAPDRRTTQKLTAGSFGVGHKPHRVAAFVAHAGYVANRTVGVGDVAEDDTASVLQHLKRVLLGRVITVEMVYRYEKASAGLDP